MRYLLLFLLLPLLTDLSAQMRAAEYLDVVYLKGGEAPVEGTIMEYNHGKGVRIVEESGELRTFSWSDIRRVNFRLDRNRLREVQQRLNQEKTAAETNWEEGTETATPAFRPNRKWYHQVSGAINLGRTSTDFGFGATTIGGGFAYHYVRPVSFLKVGGGLDISLMSDARAERTLSLTGFAESPLFGSKKRVQPLIRIEAGPSVPFGESGSGNEIISRNVGLLVHPSIGLEFKPKKDGWGSLVFDFGYRFLNSRFTIQTVNLDELERRVDYRRLVFRGAIRF